MLVRHENGRLHVGVLFQEAAHQCTDECGTGTVCFEHMTARLKEVADLLREKELQNQELQKIIENALDVLGPVAPKSSECTCEGCVAEIGEAISILSKTDKPNPEPCGEVFDGEQKCLLPKPCRLHTVKREGRS